MSEQRREYVPLVVPPSTSSPSMLRRGRVPISPVGSRTQIEYQGRIRLGQLVHGRPAARVGVMSTKVTRCEQASLGLREDTSISASK